MKRIILCVLVLSLGINAMMAGGGVTVKSKVSNVTVFPGSAQVTRTASFNAGSGVSEIVFENVSVYLNTSSIQAKGKGSFTILDVKFNYKQPEIVLTTESNELPPKIIREIALLEDSLVYLNFDLSEITAKIEAYNLEKTILMNNQLIKGNGGDTITELKATMDYFRLKITDINAQVQNLRKEEFKMRKQLNRMELRLDELQAYNQQQNPNLIPKAPIPQIVVTISADVAVAGTMEISYMVNNAGWTPSYDLKTSGIDQPVQLAYKADVWQNTGEEWENAKLRLSTITPSANNVKPILPINYIYYYNYNTVASYSSGRDKKDAPSSALDYERSESIAGGTVSDADYAYNYTQAVQTMTNVEFDIKLTYTIPSDGEIHILPIQNETIPTTYVYHIVPKLESQAFLIAKLTDWQKLDLLPGKANIYFDGTFVGETQINPYTLDDTLDLALGRDRSLQIQRKQLKNETENKLVGSMVVKTISYEITVKNTKMVKTNIVLQDNIPVTTDETIKIVMVNNGKSKYSETTGLMQWNESIAAGETKKYTYTYTIEYDSAKPLNMNF